MSTQRCDSGTCKYCPDDDAIDRHYRRLKNDVVFALVAVAVIEVLFTFVLINIVWR